MLCNVMFELQRFDEKQKKFGKKLGLCQRNQLCLSAAAADTRRRGSTSSSSKRRCLASLETPSQSLSKKSIGSVVQRAGDVKGLYPTNNSYMMIPTDHRSAGMP